VARVAPYVVDIEQQNRTLEIEVEFDDAAFSRTLLPGTSADVEVILRRVDDVLRIPAYAILEGGKVLVLGNGRIEGRTITTGLRNWEYAEAKDGLREGYPVVISLDRAEVKEGRAPSSPPAPLRRHRGTLDREALRGALIELRGLTRHYKVGDQVVCALENADLSIPDGDYVASWVLPAPASRRSCTLLRLSRPVPRRLLSSRRPRGRRSR